MGGEGGSERHQRGVTVFVPFINTELSPGEILDIGLVVRTMSHIVFSGNFDSE